MKTKLLFIICLAFSHVAYVNAQIDLINSAQNGASNAANGAADNAGSNAVNNGIKSMFGSKKKDKKKDTVQSSSSQSNSSSSASGAQSSGSTSSQQNPGNGDLKVYSNYDFVPGDTVLFEDNFADDQDGEFPAHWSLEQGQGIINKLDGENAFFLTEGNYVHVSPRMKNPSYLTSNFTVEFDYYVREGSSGLVINMKTPDGSDRDINYNPGGDISTGYFTNELSGSSPNINSNDFTGKWHHGAFIVKNNQIKCYVDQYRVLVAPGIDFAPVSLNFAGIASNDNPLIFKNVRIASGGNMNMLGKKFTESKIVTHGINFDVDKATIKPESMGTLNMIVGVMKDNPDLKFEVDGHTDNSGNSQHNMTLSQQRADAVKNQLVSMGVSSSRLTTKGFGDSKPISDNNTPEGKANNRRVEFVKM